MIRRELRAKTQATVGRVVLRAGEVLAVMEFPSIEHAEAFRGQLRWSAFEWADVPVHVPAPVPEPDSAPAAAPSKRSKG
jgi:hypothetical protein